MAERLHLLAVDGKDLEVVSALMQDAAVRTGDIAYDARAHVLALVANRYRWEARARSRARAGLRIGSVTRARRRNWPTSDEAVLELLAIRADGATLVLDFAGGSSLRLDVEAIDLTMEDLTGPWGTRTTPAHG